MGYQKLLSFVENITNISWIYELRSIFMNELKYIVYISFSLYLLTIIIL